MATLVTGSTGCVGSNIVKTLAQRGHEVVCFDVIAADALVRKYVEPWREQVTFIQGDIVNKGDLERVTAHHNITKIVHAAVFTARRLDIETDQSRSIVDINVVGTANLLDLACGLSLERFLYVSTEGVYGLDQEHSPDKMVHEDDTLYLRNLYTSTKYASELLTRRYGELHGFQTVSARIGPSYGPMERITPYRAHVLALHDWTGSVVRGEPMRVGDRTWGGDFIYMDDTAAGICTVLDAPSLTYDVYNIAAGRRITTEEVIQVLRGLRPSFQVVDDPSKDFGLVRAVMDVTRVREDLGFTPSFDLTAGISDYLQWRETFSYQD